MSDFKKQFFEWLREIYSLDRIEKVEVVIYTKNNKYEISAEQDYLGAFAVSLVPKEGEEWVSLRDLPDGDFSRETWDGIKQAIKHYEAGEA